MSKKWSRQEKLPVEEMERHACPNCGHMFQGYFCPSCGQSDTEFNRPFGFVFYDFLGNFFSFDSRFFLTFLDLFLKPGRLTTEFFKGKRARYAPPLKIFIFLSFVLFLLLEVLTGKGLDAALESPAGVMPGDSIPPMAGLSGRPAAATAFADSLRLSGIVDLDNAGLSVSGGSISDILEAAALKVEAKLKETPEAADRRQLTNTINIIRSPERLVATILKYLSWAAFLMLPVSALLLKLFYIRRKVYYVRHLIFSVHTHSFVFLLLSLVLALILIFPSWTSLFLWLLILIPVYSYVAFLKVYNQSYRKTFLKFTLLGGIYGMLLVFLVSGVLVNALLENIR